MDSSISEGVEVIDVLCKAVEEMMNESEGRYL